MRIAYAKSIPVWRGMILAALMALGGCASAPHMPDSDPEMAPPVVKVAPAYHDGGVYHAGRGLSLFQDIKARQVGDILTVMLLEQTRGQKSSDNSLNKASSASISTPLFGGRARPNMQVDVDAGRTFNGEATSSQSNSLNGSITVTVHEVLPGGNLLVKGEKWIKINQGKEYIRLSGIVRPRDVDADNTVYSTEVANAHITYSATGAHEDANSTGWASRILFSEIWPF